MNHIKYSWLILGLMLVMSSCKSFVEDINDDPNNATDAPLAAVLNASLTGMIIAHEGEDARLAGMWSRQFTGSDRQYSAFDVYNVNAENFAWDKYYIAIENAQVSMNKAEELNDAMAMAVTKIIRAHSMSVVTSLWGNCPFDEANRFPEITDPVFDGQVSVYNNCLDLIESALTDLSSDPTSDIVAGVDHYFAGDAAAWRRVANSIKARINLHLGNSAEAAAAAGQGIVNDADSWMIPHTGGANLQDQNIYYSFGQVNREGYLTANGAILPTYLDPAHASYRGNDKTDETARFNHIYVKDSATMDYDLNYAGMWTATSPFPLFSALENHLIIAESSLDSDMGVALQFLNSARAILAAQYPSGKYEAYEMADFEAGGMANNGGSAADALRHEIVEEKYASLVGQSECFNDLRRTNNLLGIPATSGGSIPERFLIPQGEIESNSNTPSPIPDLFLETPVNQ